jgi:hypothetical protein
MRPALLLAALILLSACSREPAFAPIPAQLPRVDAPDPPNVPCYFSMSEPRADNFIVRDITLGLSAGLQRWTQQKPAVRCKLPNAGPWNIAMDFIATDVTMRDTGPITLTFTVNGRELSRLRCDKPGRQQFRAPLPPDLALPGAELVLQASIDKPWVSREDGAKLGVLLIAMGFIQP